MKKWDASLRWHDDGGDVLSIFSSSSRPEGGRRPARHQYRFGRYSQL